VRSREEASRLLPDANDAEAIRLAFPAERGQVYLPSLGLQRNQLIGWVLLFEAEEVGAFIRTRQVEDVVARPLKQSYQVGWGKRIARR
jgi:hypothetical protein